MSARRRSRTQGASPWSCLIIGFVLVAVVVCGITIWVARLLNPQEGAGTPTAREGDVVLQFVYTPEKDQVLKDLLAKFQAGNPKTPQGKRVFVEATSMDAEALLAAALEGKCQVISPDSSIWLTQLDAQWRSGQGNAASLIGETTRYAVSPVVIAMWESVAQGFGYPATPVGWQEITQRARTNSAFKWSHPSTNTASGFLATLAVFYAGAGKTRGLTQEDVQAQATLDYVSAVERTVRYYGEGETVVINRALREGPGFLDAFVVPEQMVIYFNQQTTGPRLVAVYPREGTLWQDHPLALLEQPNLSQDQRQAYRLLRDYLLSADVQKALLQQGYRPADLTIPLTSAGSPFSAARGVNPTEPQTTLQIPAANVIEVVRQAWQYTKRRANIILVADISGSMEGDKLTQAQEAMLTFLGQIQASEERVGLVTFSTSVQDAVPLAEMGTNRTRLENTIRGLTARGNTALLDGTDRAYGQLQALKDTERINAVVVMTDGKENASRLRLNDLTQRVRSGNQSGVPVILFCVGYGGDADMEMLRSIAEPTGGQARRGDPETIRDLYKILSTYF